MKTNLPSQYKHEYRVFISLILAVLINAMLFQPASGQEAGVTFGETKIENHFSKGLKFSIKIDLIQTNGAHINLWYQLGADNWMQQSPNCDVKITDVAAPSKYFVCVIFLDLSGIPPQTPVTYKWELADPNDNPIKFSDEKVTIYSDIKFNWLNLNEDNLTIWWHDHPSEFAQQILTTANISIQKQEVFYDIELEYPIQIVVLNSEDELYEWREKISRSIGGEAFPWLGTTVQIFPLDLQESTLDYWINDIVPHEISHLYFFQATAREQASPPIWLNEGMAGYNELNDYSSEWSLIQQAIAQQTLIPLNELRYEFTGADEKINLSYAESTTAIIYAVETYGQEGINKLFSAFQAGESSDEAFLQAFGRTVDDFEKDWKMWVVERASKAGNAMKYISYFFIFMAMACGGILLSVFAIIFLISVLNNKTKKQSLAQTPGNME